MRINLAYGRGSMSGAELSRGALVRVKGRPDHPVAVVIDPIETAGGRMLFCWWGTAEWKVRTGLFRVEDLDLVGSSDR